MLLNRRYRPGHSLGNTLKLHKMTNEIQFILQFF